MNKDHVQQLRYLGPMPQSGYVEFGFRIESKENGVRQVVLTIENDLLQNNDLKIQEAPDLCYQKVLMGLDNEKADARIPPRIPVTATDIEHYRDLHPNAKWRKSAKRGAK